MSSTIVDIRARQILDSRGNPTIEVDVELADGSFGRAAVPSGASTGVHEAWELRDGDKTKYLGKGVLQAVDNVNSKLADELCGMDALDQVALDHRMIELDGTENKKSLGANAILGVSLADGPGRGRSLRAAAVPLSGRGRRPAAARPHDEHHQRRHARRQRRRRAGVHGHAAGRSRASATPSAAAARCSTTSRRCCKSKKLSTNVGDEGGFAPDLKSNADALDVIVEAVGKAGYELGKQVFIALDPAASEFYDADKKRYSVDGKEIDAAALVDIYAKWVEKYPICSIEDGCAEDDWDGWKLITERLGDKIQLVGDDVFVTNTKRLQRGIDEGVANSILIKVNQIGTLDRDDRGHRAGPAQRLHQPSPATAAARPKTRRSPTWPWRWAPGQIKTGSASRTDRMAKYNQLLRIEEILGDAALYGGPLFPKKR